MGKEKVDGFVKIDYEGCLEYVATKWCGVRKYASGELTRCGVFIREGKKRSVCKIEIFEGVNECGVSDVVTRFNCY